MSLEKNISKLKGVATVQIEGYFTERFINLCKLNNIKIWNIRTIVNGVVRFDIAISEFKKLKPIVKKTKCRLRIKNKKGAYFIFFKYRKRKTFVLLLTFLIILSIVFSTFIWKIEITGNVSISNEEILSALKSSGIYIGKNRLRIDKKDTINEMRVELPDLSWIGIELDGTKAIVKVVEKTKIDEENVQEAKIGNIIADKSGVITKIIPENGTALLKEGSYVEEGNILIEGAIYSKLLEPQYVTAKGIVKINTEYQFKQEYPYSIMEKNYLSKKKYTLGITIDSKEMFINYLNKEKKYDINKYSKTVHLFGKEISLDWYECLEYEEVEKIRSKEELVEIAYEDSGKYIEEILAEVKSGIVVDRKETIEETENGIIFTMNYVVNEQIGKFVERN